MTGYQQASAIRAVGLLLPATNRVMEQDFIRWLPKELRLHINRLNAPRERPEDMRENLIALTTGIEETARLLGLAEPSVIGFGCTSGSFLNGPDWDADIRNRIARATNVSQVVSTSAAVVDALRVLGAKRVAVCTPYPEPINALLLRYLEAFDFKIASVRAVDGWGLGGIFRLPPEIAISLALESQIQEADAIFISCTNFRAAEVIQRIENETCLPVVTSNQATFWACLRSIGFEPAVPELGRLAESAMRAELQ